MDPGSDASRTAGTTAANGGWLRSITTIVIFDVAAPLAAYDLLRSAGMTAVTALLLSGVFPALGVTLGTTRHRRLGVVGALVLAGILVGTVFVLVSHSAKLLLVEGSVPTAVFGVACLGSLRTRRPLIYSFALEFTGSDTAKGREMTSLWQYEGYRRVLRIITAVWGIGFLLEAALRRAVHRAQRAVRGQDRLGQPGPGIDLAAGLCRGEPVQAQVRDRLGQPHRRRHDRRLVRPRPPQVRVLDHILGVRGRAEQPVGQAKQPGALRLELACRDGRHAVKPATASCPPSWPRPTSLMVAR